MTKRSVHPYSLWHPIRRRRFNSALVVHLARHGFPRLNATGQARVDGELADVFKAQNLDPYDVWLQIVGRSSDQVAILRGIAMARLKMPTGADGLEWAEFVPPSWLRRPISALFSFRRFEATTDEAADFLRSRGLILDETVVQGSRWMADMHTRYP